MRGRRDGFWACACVVALAVAFALAYGVEFGTGNQHTYLLDPLVRAFPELYRNDWFVAENHHYHVAFAVLTAPLFAVDPDGAVAFGIAQLVVSVATFVAIYGVVAAVTGRARVVVFAGLVGLVVLGGDRALGGSYLFGGYLQPSSLATLAWLLALNAWIRERILVAGVALGIGAVFHLNYALLGIGVFGLCELITQRFQLRRMALLLAPSLIVVLAFLPAMIASSQTGDDALALQVLVKFVFPGHFKPSSVRVELPALLGWFVIALALRPDDRTGAPARLFWFAVVTMGCCIAAVTLISIPPLLTLTRLFVWRIAPFGIVVAQLLMLVEVGKIARGDRVRPHGWQLAGLVIAAIAIAYNAFARRREPDYAEVISCLLVMCAIALAVRREQLVIAACAALCAFGLWAGRARLVSPILFDGTDTDVTKWARTSSPRDAVFMVPPYQSRFRLRARRAVVADIKSPPMYLDELVEWYRRLCTLVGAREVASIPALAARWDALRPEQLVAAATTFHADYVVLEKSRSVARLTLPVAYEDSVYVVYVMAPP